MDNLDNFSTSFFGGETPPEDKQEAPAANEENDEDVNENGDDTPATEADEDAHSEEEPDEDEDQSDEDEDEKPEPQKKGKKSAKERIEELYAANKQKERELAELRAAVEALKVPTEAKTEPQTEATAAAPEAPSPDAVDKDGNPVYPLGEFDPGFIRDLTRFTIAQETKAAKETEAKEAQQRMVEAAQEELKNSWLQKLDEAEKELPDLRDSLADVGAAFSGIDPNYGEYLAATIMSCDNGPQIMYYFSQNIGEAQKIVASGPAAAALAIGRLDAKFVKSTVEEKRNTKKQSAAPNPPENRNRGSSGKFSVAGDTTDLSAFEKEFFGKK
jgi:hypothetical protein